MSDLSQQKLQKLIEIEGYQDDIKLLEAIIFDSVSPAICMNLHCNYTAELEPDQRSGWCEECQANTMKSALVLADLI